jgi:hypothetical protein
VQADEIGSRDLDRMRSPRQMVAHAEAFASLLGLERPHGSIIAHPPRTAVRIVGP